MIYCLLNRSQHHLVPVRSLKISVLLNTGVEFQLSTTNINNNNFKWTTYLNVSTLDNKITDLPDDDVIGNLNILREGEPINAFSG